MNGVASYVRNIQGRPVELRLIEVGPNEVRLDPTNPRIGFSINQLPEAERNEAACVLLLTSQEETESLRRSIVQSSGVQEPIYVRADKRVAEGNRRVVATRAALDEFPGDPRFTSMPAWLIPEGTPEFVVQDLLNEIHLGSVRGWAPYEKALQMRALISSGLIEDEIAERYRMTAREVRHQLSAVDMMDKLYFPTTEEPSDPEHRSKFSYFLEFYKNGQVQKIGAQIPNLQTKFAGWVRDGKINTGERVRRLPKIFKSKEATRLLDVAGFDAAEEYLAKMHPEEQSLYATLEACRRRLEAISLSELRELRDSAERRDILRALVTEAETVLRELPAPVTAA